MNVTERRIDEIRPYERNPRDNAAAVDAVAKSIEQFGFRQPIVVDKDGVIVAGHTRWLAARQLGLATVPVLVADDLTPEQVRAYRIADNQVGTLAKWDLPALKLELGELKQANYDLAPLGFSAGELSQHLKLTDPREGNTDPDDVPEPPAEPVTKPGDLWQLGDHRLLCGDATSGDEVDRLFGSDKADMLLTDPPYGVSYVGKTTDALTMANDDVTEEAWAPFLTNSLAHGLRICRPGAYWYSSGPQGPLLSMMMQVWRDIGTLRQVLIGEKDTIVLGRSEYHYQHEPILFGWVPGPRHELMDRSRSSIWKHDRPKASRHHPTMKPVALFAHAIGDGSVNGEIVYDPFIGSGTSLVAAEQTGRRCYGLEIDPVYCDVAIQRWEQFTGRHATKVSQGSAA